MTFNCPHCNQTIYAYKEAMKPTDAVSLRPRVSPRDLEMTIDYLTIGSLNKVAIKYNRAAVTVNRVVLHTVRKLLPELYKEYEGMLGVFKRHDQLLIAKLKELI